LDDIDIYSHVEDSTKLIDYTNAHKAIVDELLRKLDWKKYANKFGWPQKL
jgi:hypothetical protein